MLSRIARASQVTRPSVSSDTLMHQFHKELDKLSVGDYAGRLELMRKELSDNTWAVNRLLKDIRSPRSHGNSALMAHMSGIISARKEYSFRLRLYIERVVQLAAYNNGYFN